MTAEARKKNTCVLIPYWIADQIKRNGRSMDSVLNLDKLLEICSVEDIAAMGMINGDMAPLFIGQQLADINLGSINVIWSLTYPTLHTKISTYALSMSADSVFSRLHDTSSYESTAQAAEFDFYHLAMANSVSGGLGFVLPRLHWGSAVVGELAKQYIRKSFGYSKYDTVARDNVFKTYLSNLWLNELTSS